MGEGWGEGVEMHNFYVLFHILGINNDDEINCLTNQPFCA